MNSSNKKTTGSEAPSQRLTKSEQRLLASDAKKFGKTWVSAQRGDILARYAIGEMALKIEKKFGKEGISALAKEIKRSDSFVYSYAAVAKTWSRRELRELLKNAEGSIEWSHLVLLSNQKRVDAKKRQELLKQIITKKMGPTALKLDLYPKADPDDVDPDLVEDGFVDADAEDPGDPGDDLADAAGDEADGDRDAAIEPRTRAGGATQVSSGVLVADGKLGLAGRVRSLQRFTAELSTLATQTEEVNEQVFDGFEQAVQADSGVDGIDNALKDLASTKSAAESAQRASEATIDKCAALMEALRAEIARRGVHPVEGSMAAVQMSGTQAEDSSTGTAPSEGPSINVVEPLFEGNSKVLLMGPTKAVVAGLRTGIADALRRSGAARKVTPHE